ncbi:MAG: carbohydrate porin [Acidobacteriota bacterium]
MRRSLGTISLVLLFGCAQLGANPPVSSDPTDPLQRNERLFRALEEQGFHFQLDYSVDFFSIVSGGLRRRTDYIHNVDVVVRMDGEKALGWPGMTFQVYGLNIEGRIPSDDAGDAQGLSNIAAPSATRLYEIWLEQSLAHDRFSLLAGLYDLNTEFDVIQSANVFLNPSHGIDPTFSQSGINGPSIFPYTTLAVRARVKPTSWSYIESAVLNGLSGDPDDPRGTHIILSGRKGILSATEAGYLFHSEKAASPKSKRRLHRRVITSQAPAIRGTIAAGIWYYTSRFDPIAPDSLPDRATAIRGDPGFYLLGERRLFRVGDDSSRGMSVFSRIGFADSRIYRFASYVGAGAVYTGLFESRPHDQLGFAMAIARNGDEYLLARHRAGAPAFRSEWNLELTYFSRIGNWLRLQPDLQYVIHPNTDPSTRNALCVDLRIEISFR